MILITSLILVLSVAWVKDVGAVSLSKVFVQTGPEVGPSVEYLQYGGPSVPYASPQLAQLSGASFGSVVPFASTYGAPCGSACMYPGQAIASSVVPNSNIVTYKSPISSLPVVYAANDPTGYEYSYIVYDQHTGDHKAHSELSDGSLVRGEYSFLQPDGLVREVQYMADDVKGFNAIVKNFLPSGETKVEQDHPTPPCHEVKSEALKEHEHHAGHEHYLYESLTEDHNAHGAHEETHEGHDHGGHIEHNEASSGHENLHGAHEDDARHHEDHVEHGDSDEHNQDHTHENELKQNHEHQGGEAHERHGESHEHHDEEAHERHGESHEQHSEEAHEHHGIDQEHHSEEIHERHGEGHKNHGEKAHEGHAEGHEHHEESHEEHGEEVHERHGGPEHHVEETDDMLAHDAHESHEHIVGIHHDAEHETHQAATAEHGVVEENILVPYSDIIRCIQSAISGINGSPTAHKPESPLTYVILNKPC